MQIKVMGGFLDGIDFIDYYRQDRLLQTDGQDGRNGQHEAGQAAEETRHMLVEMLKMQQNEDF